MIAALIAAISLLALLPLFVSYCGTVVSSARKIEPSDRARSLADVADRSISEDDFERILQLVRLCPEPEADRSTVRAIAIYFRVLGMLGRAFRNVGPGLAEWAVRERANCSHFAAVVLDGCISSSHSLLLEQTGDDAT